MKAPFHSLSQCVLSSYSIPGTAKDSKNKAGPGPYRATCPERELDTQAKNHQRIYRSCCKSYKNIEEQVTKSVGGRIEGSECLSWVGH